LIQVEMAARWRARTLMSMIMLISGERIGHDRGVCHDVFLPRAEGDHAALSACLKFQVVC
jgi:hypothetical protein